MFLIEADLHDPILRQGGRNSFLNLGTAHRVSASCLQGTSEASSPEAHQIQFSIRRPLHRQHGNLRGFFNFVSCK